MRSEAKVKKMVLEALSNSNELFNCVIYDTILATPCSYEQHSSETTSFLFHENTTTTLIKPHNDDDDHHHYHQLEHQVGASESCSLTTRKRQMPPEAGGDGHGRSRQGLGVVVRKKRRRKPRVCKNKEEAESQRMTHIAVERNRRKQMNEHLAVLRSLMPESYVQRGDQASIVGGAIEFVKELEHLLQSLEAQKLQVLQGINNNGGSNHDHDQDSSNINGDNSKLQVPPPFAQFFVYPQYTCSQISNKYTSKTKAAIADIEVTLIETHASLRILSRRSPRQLSKLITGFQTLHLSVLHLSITTLDPLVLYSVSVKVEEACLLTSVDDIAAAVHHMLRIIEEEAALCS